MNKTANGSFLQVYYTCPCIGQTVETVMIFWALDCWGSLFLFICLSSAYYQVRFTWLVLNQFLSKIVPLFVWLNLWKSFRWYHRFMKNHCSHSLLQIWLEKMVIWFLSGHALGFFILTLWKELTKQKHKKTWKHFVWPFTVVMCYLKFVFQHVQLSFNDKKEKFTFEIKWRGT